MKLLTENPRNATRALRAFRERFSIVRGRFVCDFEHGQLWVNHPATGAAWSVVDAEGGPAVDGFDFEQVTLPDDESALFNTGYTE